MKKFLLALALGTASLPVLFAQNNDSTQVEIGLQTLAFPDFHPPSSGDIFYNTGGSKARMSTTSIGVDARFRMSKAVKLRIGLGYGERRSSNGFSDDRRSVDGPLNTYSYKTLNQVLFALAGLGYEYPLGRFGLAAGPELTYYHWLPTKQSIITREESDGFVGYVVRQWESKYTWSRAHHVGLGFFLGVNFRVCKGLVLSGELHQGYSYSILSGTYIRSLSETTTINNTPGITTTASTSEKVNSRRGAFVYPLPSLAVRYCW